MPLILATTLTILAGIWRFADGRGWGPTWARNVAGLVIALAAATNGLGLTWQAGICSLGAAATLILGFTDWSNLGWSLARYGAPTCVIASVGYVGSAPVLACVLYALGGVLVGIQYPMLQKTGWRYATATSEVISGAIILGGISWL